MSDVEQPGAAENTEAQKAENAIPDQIDTPATETPESDSESLPEPDTADPEQFPREYVQQLRRESASYREKAKTAEKDATDANAFAEGALRRLHIELVRADGRLADPADLEFAVENLFDGDSLTSAIDQLLVDKPHLRSRRPVGDVGQGVKGSTETPSLLSMLKTVI